jgi:hypothetical protein
MADSPSNRSAQGRARIHLPPPVETRVVEIRGLMEAGLWKRGTARELAERWGVSESRVREHAAEASRQLRPMGLVEARAKVEALLEEAQVKGLWSKTKATDLVAVAGAWMKLYGLDRHAGAGGARSSSGSNSPAGGATEPGGSAGAPAGWEEDET